MSSDVAERDRALQVELTRRFKVEIVVWYNRDRTTARWCYELLIDGLSQWTGAEHSRRKARKMGLRKAAHLRDVRWEMQVNEILSPGWQR